MAASTTTSTWRRASTISSRASTTSFPSSASRASLRPGDSSRCLSGATRKRCANGAMSRSTAKRRQKEEKTFLLRIVCAFVPSSGTTRRPRENKRRKTASVSTTGSTDSPHLSPEGRDVARGGGILRRQRSEVSCRRRDDDPPRGHALALRGGAAAARRPDAGHAQPLRHRAVLPRRALHALDRQQSGDRRAARALRPRGGRDPFVLRQHRRALPRLRVPEEGKRHPL